MKGTETIEASLPRRVRVLSYPPQHPYVDRLGTVATLVHQDQPWPRLPDLYDPAWIATHSDEWDIAHLHFTWEQYPAERLAEVVRAHREASVPLVWTVHDLRNPHTDGRDDERYLRILAEHADVVLTLTRGAADEILQRFERRALVVEHGPLLTVRPSDPGTETGPRRILVHAKSLRANLDVEAAVEAARAAIGVGAELELVIAAHDQPQVRAALARFDRLPGVRFHYHPAWETSDLVAAIAAADALLLPYRWGTHSGMVELAADIGTPVIASKVGYLHEQTSHITVPIVAGRIDVAALTNAFLQVARGEAGMTVPWHERRRSYDRFLEVHRQIYAELTA